MTKFEGWGSVGLSVLLILLIVVSSSPMVYVGNDNHSVVLINAIDGSTGAIEVIDYAHHEVHSGSHYNYRDYYPILKNGVKEFLFVTPNSSEEAHMIFGIGVLSSTVVVQVFDNCSVSANGTLEPARNRNRNFPNGNLALLYEDPNITIDGSEISSAIFGAGKSSEGGGGRDTEEIVYRRNTNYCFRITEQNVDATSFNVLFDWYEHSPKN